MSLRQSACLTNSPTTWSSMKQAEFRKSGVCHSKSCHGDFRVLAAKCCSAFLTLHDLLSNRYVGSKRPPAHKARLGLSDKASWYNMPHSMSVGIGQSRGIDPTPNTIHQVSDVLAAAHGEPIGHELIREAFDNVPMNPRSALLIGVSALETGLKDYTRSRIPYSESFSKTCRRLQSRTWCKK